MEEDKSVTLGALRVLVRELKEKVPSKETVEQVKASVGNIEALLRTI